MPPILSSEGSAGGGGGGGAVGAASCAWESGGGATGTFGGWSGDSRRDTMILKLVQKKVS